MKWNKQMTKTLFMAIILLGFGTFYIIFDYSSMPSKEDRWWNGEFRPVTYKELGDSRKTLTICLGDGFISNIENIFIHISLLFGAFRLVDFLFLFEIKTEIDIRQLFKKKPVSKNGNFDKPFLKRFKCRKIINKIRNKTNMEK